MKWSEECKPDAIVSHYNHIITETPIGKMMIEWKGWKENPSYDVMLNDAWIGVEYDLESAKRLGEEHLNKIFKELKSFLSDNE